MIPAPAEGTPGSEFGTNGTVRLDLRKDKAVVAVFFSERSDAKALSSGDLGKLGKAELIGTVFLSTTARPGPELKAFRTCIKG